MSVIIFAVMFVIIGHLIEGQTGASMCMKLRRQIHRPHVVIVVQKFLKDFFNGLNACLELSNLALDSTDPLKILGIDLHTPHLHHALHLNVSTHM